MSEKFEKASDDVVEETKDKVAKDFEENDLTSPNDFAKKKKPTTEDMKLIHIGLDHLFMGVLQNLRQSQAELAAIKDDERAQALAPFISSLIQITVSAIDNLAQGVNAIPTVDEIGQLLAKLSIEQQLAQSLIAKAPKEKLH